MKEEENNVVYVCSGCTDELIQKFNENVPDIKPGDYVKARFGSKDKAESMWILVEEATNDKIKGELNNIPIIVNMNLHDKVSVDLFQCFEHLPKEGSIIEKHHGRRNI